MTKATRFTRGVCAASISYGRGRAPRAPLEVTNG